MPISTVIARPTSCSALATSVGLESRHTYRYRTATVLERRRDAAAARVEQRNSRSTGEAREYEVVIFHV